MNLVKFDSGGGAIMPRPELPLVLLTLSAVWCAAQHMNSGSVAPSSYIWREVKSKEKMGLLFVSAVWRREGVGSNGTVLKCVRRRFGGVVVRCSSTDHSGEFARGGSRNDTATVDRAVVEQIERNVAEAPERQVDVEPLPVVKNRYLAVRHGQSESNLEGIISSDVEVGSWTHSLTPLGRRQSRIAATSLLDIIGRDQLPKVLLYSSPYRRALETAEEAAEALCRTVKFENEAEEIPPYACPTVQVEPLLRERWFGDLDGKIISSYNMIWPVDLKDAFHTNFDCESVNAVCVRMRDLILKLESQHQGNTIVLFGHADVLQILQMYFSRADPRLFSQYRFRNGEVRELLQDPSSLPDPVKLTYQ